MSEFDPRGGGQQFSKMSEIQKSLKFPMGGGQAYLGIFPKFFRFFFMMAPLRIQILISSFGIWFNVVLGLWWG